MDHCQNASEPESTDGLVAVPELGEPEPTDLDSATRECEEGVALASGSDDGEVDSAVGTLDAWADDLRQRHLQRALSALEDDSELSDEDRAAVAACSRVIVDEVLRRPRSELRSCAPDEAEDALALFGLADD